MRWLAVTIAPLGGLKLRGSSSKGMLPVQSYFSSQPGAGASFKWSRENVSVGARVASVISASELELDSLGRDEVLGIADGDWIWVESQWGKVRCMGRHSEALEPGTVWTWNAIGKQPGAWGLAPDANEARKGFLLNHLISDRTPNDEQANAFNDLVECYQDHLFSLVARMVPDRDQASDAVQEAFFSAFRNLASFRGGSVRSWLSRIAVNAAMDQHRRAAARVRAGPRRRLGLDGEPAHFALSVDHFLVGEHRAEFFAPPDRLFTHVGKTLGVAIGTAVRFK